MTFTFDLWPPNSLTMVNMSANFNEEAHSAVVYIMFTNLFLYMSDVTLTSDLKIDRIRPSSHYGKHVCQVWWRSTQWLSLYCVHKLISKYVNFDLDLWPHTSKINMVHPLIIVNMSTKFAGEAHNFLVSITDTRANTRNNSNVTISPPQTVARG